MSDCVAAVIVASYIYLLIKGLHTRSTSFFLGIIFALGMIISRGAILIHKDYLLLSEIFSGLAFLCLIVQLSVRNVDRQVAEEVKQVLGNAFHTTAEASNKSETNEDSPS